MKGLTKRQREIIDYIQSFIDTNGYSPSYREIGNHFCFSSIGSVYNHIKVLKKKGAIEKESHFNRSLTPITEKPMDHTSTSAVEIPFIGYIDETIDTFPQIQTITIPQSLIPSPHQTYAFRVRGDSLNQEQITDGDLLLVEVNSSPQSGDVVMCSTPSNQTFIRRYYPEGNYVRLESQSLNIDSIHIRSDEIVLKGTVVGLLRIF